jgi:hypothetical protein
MKLLVVLFLGFLCAGKLLAADESVPIDTSQQAVEAAYQAVRAGDAVPVATLKQTAEGLLVKLINGAVATGEFLADQVPIVIKELIAWKTASYAATIVISILAAGICGWLMYKDLTDWDSVGIFLFSGMAGLISVIIMVVNVFNLLQITLAPRVWLIEYAASLVNGG